MNWAARDSASGETAIFARVATGPDAVLIDPPPGFPYTGGAFGEEVRATETRTITVLSELLLEVELPSTLANDDLGALEVRAGHADVDGEPVWKPGIAIEILTDGGSVQQATGTTDVDGQFVTLAQLDPGSEEIIITVTARDSAGQEAVRSVEAGSGDASVWPLSESWAYEGFVGISLDPPHEDHNRESVHLDSASSVSGDRDDEWTDVVDGDTIQYRSSGSVSSSWSITYGEGGTLKELSTHAAVSAQASWEVLSGGTAEASHGARSIAGVEMYFQVVDGPAVLTIEVTGTGGLAIHPEIDDPVFVTSGVETVTLPAGRYYLTAGAQADAAASATGTHASDTATAEASATVTFSGGG